MQLFCSAEGRAGPPHLQSDRCRHVACCDAPWSGLQAALCSLLGSAASYAYLTLMQQQVDSVSPTDEVPIWEAEDNVEGFARPFAIGLAGYR